MGLVDAEFMIEKFSFVSPDRTRVRAAAAQPMMPSASPAGRPSLCKAREKSWLKGACARQPRLHNA